MKPFSRLFRKPTVPLPPSPPTASERIASLQTATAEVALRTAFGNDEPGLKAAARQRLAQLIDGGSIDFVEFCRGREAQPDTMAVAALCQGADRLGQLLPHIDDASALARLVTDGPSSRVRQSAAAAIVHPAQLHDLLPRVRGKDKAVYRIIKQKCDALTAERRKIEDASRASAELCTSLERHAARAHDPLYAATLDSLKVRWRALPMHTDPEVEQRGEQAIERCGEAIAAHETGQAAQREARETRERELQARQRAAAGEAAEQATARAQALAEATAARDAAERARAEQQTTEAEARREIAGLVRLANAALQRGDTRKAARFRAGLEDALQTAAPVPPYLTRNVQQLDERLNELRQWKDYVVAPKRIELIEEMEALVGSTEEPVTLAEHIRALQQEWRTINKGIASDVSAEAERFQAAFQAAFKPCQAYFAAQAAVRRENLAARRHVLERLQAFEASLPAEHPDYPLILQVLREAPLEWRSHSPVDRDAGRVLESDFHEALGRLRKVVNAWYESNASEKQALITQARHLSTVEDTTQAIDGVKRLQALWKESGPVSREQSQVLWEEFRGLCNAAFERREQAYQQYSSGLEAAKAQAVALCEQVEASGAADGQAAAHAKIREWQVAFDALPELPRTDARFLRERFERAVSRIEAGLAQQDQREVASAESDLFEAARHVRACERAAMQNAPDAERETLRSAAELFMAGAQRWPKGSQAVLKQALARADSATEADVAARETALRLLCIRAEILSSMPTPLVDEPLRRDYEMRLLMERMGQASQADEQEWEAMRLEWIGIGAIAPEIHDELERRFRACLAKRPAPQASPFRNHSGRDRETRNSRGSDDGKSRRDGRGRPDAGGRRG